MSHQSQVPPAAYHYFRQTQPDTNPGYQPHEPVLIAQVFTPSKGWKNHSTRKRVSGSWLRGLRREGVTHVALSFRGRQADFSIGELLSRRD